MNSQTKPLHLPSFSYSEASTTGIMADESSSKLNRITALFLFINAAASVYSARGDPRNFGFVVFAYGTLMALLLCIRLVERKQAAAERAGVLKAVVWALATVLNASFAWRVADMMPFKLAASAIWVLVLVFSAGSFYALILYRSPADSPVSGEKDVKKKLFTEEQI